MRIKKYKSAYPSRIGKRYVRTQQSKKAEFKYLANGSVLTGKLLFDNFDFILNRLDRCEKRLAKIEKRLKK